MVVVTTHKHFLWFFFCLQNAGVRVRACRGIVRARYGKQARARVDAGLIRSFKPDFFPCESGCERLSFNPLRACMCVLECMDFYFDLPRMCAHKETRICVRVRARVAGGDVFFRGSVAHQMAITPSYTRCAWILPVSICLASHFLFKNLNRKTTLCSNINRASQCTGFQCSSSNLNTRHVNA